jgi:hypothetical protein
VKTSKTQLAPAHPLDTGTTLAHRLLGVLVFRAEEILAEVAPTMRRVRHMVLAITICIPLFTVGFVVALWHLAH